jgi:competence protein ComEA
MKGQVRAAAVLVVLLAAASTYLGAPPPPLGAPPAPPVPTRPAADQPLAAVLHHGGKLDLNRATLEDLAALPGIGPGRAQRIARQRARLGGFRSVDDLASVRGIGPRTLERLRPLVALPD